MKKILYIGVLLAGTSLFGAVDGEVKEKNNVSYAVPLMAAGALLTASIVAAVRCSYRSKKQNNTNVFLPEQIGQQVPFVQANVYEKIPAKKPVLYVYEETGNEDVFLKGFITALPQEIKDVYEIKVAKMGEPHNKNDKIIIFKKVVGRIDWNVNETDPIAKVINPLLQKVGFDEQHAHLISYSSDGSVHGGDPQINNTTKQDFPLPVFALQPKINFTSEACYHSFSSEQAQQDGNKKTIERLKKKLLEESI